VSDLLFLFDYQLDTDANTTYVFSLTAYNEAEREDSEQVLLTVTTLHPSVDSTTGTT